MGKKAKNAIKAVVSGQDVVTLKEAAEQIYVDTSVSRYIVEIVTATRNHPEIQMGSSPRGSIALYGICRAYALYRGRSYVIPDDVKKLAPHVLCHRIALTHEAKINKRTPQQVMESILDTIVVPTGQEIQNKE